METCDMSELDRLPGATYSFEDAVKVYGRDLDDWENYHTWKGPEYRNE